MAFGSGGHVGNAQPACCQLLAVKWQLPLATFMGSAMGHVHFLYTIRYVSRPPKWDSKAAVAARIAAGTWPRV